VVTAPTSSPITDAQGAWTVPNVALSWVPTFSSAWVGIDGGVSDDDDLAQTGTEQDSFYGFTSYSSWWSTSAQGFLARPITLDDNGNPFDVEPGDVMSAEVDQSSTGVTFTLIDHTTDQTTTTPSDYQGLGLTAEWILEAPSAADQSGNFTVLTLAHYGSTVFNDLSTDQSSVDLNPDEEVVMEQNGTVTSFPSAPNANGDAFAIAYGSTQPSPPTGETSIISGPEAQSPERTSEAIPDELSILDHKFDSP
jgi:hypothetical protein